MPNRGFRFWSINSDNNTRSAKGQLWYKEVFFTDHTEVAITESRKVNKEAIPTYRELEDHYKEEFKAGEKS